MKTTIAAAWLSLLFVASPALADVPPDNCFIRVRPDSTMVRLIYDPFENVRETEQFELMFTPRMKGCSFGLALGGLGTSTQRFLQGNGHTLEYELEFRGGNVRNDLNLPTAVITPNPGNGPKGADIQRGSPVETVKVIVPAGQFAPAGTYRDDITVRLFRVVNGVPEQTGEDQIVSILVDIPARAQINLAGSSSPIFGGISGSGLDFGQLEQGEERDAYIQVRATSPVMLTLSSEFRSQMRHRFEGTGVPGIPYSLTIDNQTVDLSTGAKRIDRSTTHGLGADNYRIAARILDVRGRVAGQYEDVITVTVEPK